MDGGSMEDSGEQDLQRELQFERWLQHKSEYREWKRSVERRFAMMWFSVGSSVIALVVRSLLFTGAGG